MARESLGYVHLQWTCPNCQTKNLGQDRFCASCGTPQPDNVQFEQMAGAELITDKAELEQAKAGPDIHCAYCGSRNRGDANHCTQCGADLTEGEKRQAGQTLGAYSDKPAEKITCPACETPNQANASKCVNCGASLVQTPPPKPQPQAQPQALGTRSKGRSRPQTAGVGQAGLFGSIGLGLIGLLICGGLIFFFILAGRTEDVSGTVSNIGWTREVAIEGLVPVSYSGWRDDIPAGAAVGSCSERIHHTQDQPAPNAQKICGTPYVVDEGSGFGQVVQDCQYQVYALYCDYTVEEWREVDTLRVTGGDLNPRWPAVTNLAGDERPGEQREVYEIVFDTEQGRYTYTTRDPNEFAQFQTGSRWTLQVNTFNTIVDVERQ